MSRWGLHLVPYILTFSAITTTANASTEPAAPAPAATTTPAEEQGLVIEEPSLNNVEATRGSKQELVAERKLKKERHQKAKEERKELKQQKKQQKLENKIERQKKKEEKSKKDLQK